ncbi:HCO3 transporter family-domain-containing protein [Apodospora peruviana]|uniref:HCO3 transporter family-domain-containing protein n=1 Tax=Apodospora peruviana TaxID=516989 RepID=A0AAE0MBN6_9PEZI|nr:HCO3 transporter family-domain-containing protein [Apodospora peruviana]
MAAASTRRSPGSGSGPGPDAGLELPTINTTSSRPATHTPGGPVGGSAGGGGMRNWASSLVGRSRRRRQRQAAVNNYSSSSDDDGSTGAAGRRDRWWKIRLFRGMVNDIRRRAPYYASDWTDAWNYRVVPATVYMYFANILPALAFSLDMFTKTNMQYGVNEVLLASVLGAVVFAVLACQPLVIVGVTGPITVFNYTVFDIMAPTGANYLAFMCWIGLWSLVFHWILAITNSCNWLRYVTRFPCDIFGFYVAFIYLQKGIQVLERLGDDEPFYLSLAVSLLVFAIAYATTELGRSSLFTHPVRVFLKDYGTPLTVVFFTGFVHMGKMAGIPLENLPTSKAFFPTADRGWFVHFWDISVGDVFLAIPFALLLTILFWFDHNVSSLIAQGTEFPLTKPAGFHWDLFLLGLTTGVAGLLGLPFPNGLIPQAPFHTESLCVTEVVADPDEKNGGAKGHYEFKATHVVEQRVSNLAQGLLTLGTMSGPLLVVLHLIPQGVLAGLFFIMGFQALEGNGITAKILFLCRDVSLTPGGHPLKQIPRRAAIWLFVAIELIGFGATFAITQTVAAVGFPIFIFLLIPLRAWILPKWLSPHELSILDEPTASPFTMESVGGTYGGPAEVLDDGIGGAGSGNESSSDQGKKTGGGGGGRSGEASGSSRLFVAAGGRRSEEELAELGQNHSHRRTYRTSDAGDTEAYGVARRRNSAVGRQVDDDGDEAGIELHGVRKGQQQ